MPYSYCLQPKSCQRIRSLVFLKGLSLTYEKYELQRTPNKAEDVRRIQEDLNDCLILRHSLKERLNLGEIPNSFVFPLLILEVFDRNFEIFEGCEWEFGFFVWPQSLLEIFQNFLESIFDARHLCQSSAGWRPNLKMPELTQWESWMIEGEHIKYSFNLSVLNVIEDKMRPEEKWILGQWQVDELEIMKFEWSRLQPSCQATKLV